MMNIRALLLATSLATAAIVSSAIIDRANAETTADINRGSDQALELLYKSNPIALDLSKKARAVLVFPNIVKAGFVFGAAYGEGELKRGEKIDGYFNSFTGSWGLQAGAQSYGYAVFLMTKKAESYISRSSGWEIGIGPTVVVMNEGIAKNFSSSTLKDDAYAFIFDQQGLMIGISIEGTKITRIKN